MPNAYLHLADGTTIQGEHFGAMSDRMGEVVFSTGMTGYVQSLTDPSFAGQILVFTYPLIGNYGVPAAKKQASHLMANMESEKIWVEGVVVVRSDDQPSHAEFDLTFSQWLKQQGVPGLMLVDTRALTQKLRDEGVMSGKLSLKSTKPDFSDFTAKPPVPIVSHPKVVEYQADQPNGKKVALIDCGVKHGILRRLLSEGYHVTRVPWNMNPLDISQDWDGVVCSNGPGDPKDCQATISNIRAVLAAKIPYLGICLGHQLLALAIGADTYKLPFGHRGLNQPCQDLLTQKAYLTSQNHGYAVDRKTIPSGFQEWFINLNDGTSEGLINKKRKVWSVQFHPEGCPGPFDTDWIFGMLKT